MKSRNFILLALLVTTTGLGLFSMIPFNVAGATGTYSLSSDPANPFNMDMDTVYTSAGSETLNGYVVYYNRIYLTANTYYYMDCNLPGSTTEIALSRYPSYEMFNSTEPPKGIVMKPSVSSFFNITFRYPSAGSTTGTIEIGVYEIPELTTTEIQSFMDFFYSFYGVVAWKTVAPGTYDVKNIYLEWTTNDDCMDVDAFLSSGYSNHCPLSGDVILFDDEVVEPITLSQTVSGMAPFLLLGAISCGVVVVLTRTIKKSITLTR